MEKLTVITPAIASELIKWVDLDWHYKVVRVPYQEYVKHMTNLTAAMGNPDQPVVVFKTLVSEAVSLGETTEWLLEEMAFETYTFATGLRRLMALEALMQNEDSLSDADLDRFNLRKKRVYSFSFPE